MKLGGCPGYNSGMPHKNMDLMNLRRKRVYIHKQLRKLEPQVAQLHAKLTETEAAIRTIAPELPLAGRHRKPNPVFARGEFTRFVLAVLREANGPMSMRAICTRMLAMKGLDLPERWTREHTAHRLSCALAVMRGRGLVVLEGWGGSARWKVTSKQAVS